MHGPHRRSSAQIAHALPQRQRRLHPIESLTHCALGQSHHAKGGDPRADIHLDFDRESIDAGECAGEYAAEQIPSVEAEGLRPSKNLLTVEQICRMQRKGHRGGERVGGREDF